MDYIDSNSKQLSKRRFSNREEQLYHPTYDRELAFYKLVGNGDLEALEEAVTWSTGDEPERGVLSKNPLTNSKYHLIVMVAMVTRFCIEGGMNEQEAYQLSDLCINRIDEAKSTAALRPLQKEIAFAFATRMRKLKTTENHSVHCKKALDYIYYHLNEPIRIADIARHVNLDETYISKLFLKEMGTTPAAYIRTQKVEEAKNLLLYSESSCGEIAQYLGFSSSSHFAQTFKNETGCTPLAYRNANFRRHFKA